MKLSITLFSLSLIVLLISMQTLPYGKNNLQVVFRYDDYSKYSRLPMEKELFEMIKSHGGGALVGVIPFPYADHPKTAKEFDKSVFLDQEKIDLLKQYHADGTIEIAIHGFAHKNNELLDYRSEYAGMPIEEQETLLHIAKKELEKALGLSINGLVPPFNTLDRSTLDALKNQGFTLLSAASSTPFYQPDDLNYLPGGPYPNKLRKVVKNALQANHYDALIVSTQHPYDIEESGVELPEFRKKDKQVKLSDIKSDLTYITNQKKTELTSIKKLSSEPENLSAERLIANMRLRNSFVSKHRLLPGPLALYPLSGLHYTVKSAKDMYARQIVNASCLFLSILAAFVIIFNLILVFFKSSKKLRLPLLLTATFLLGLAAVKIYTNQFYFISALALNVGLAIILSIFSSKNSYQSKV